MLIRDSIHLSTLHIRGLRVGYSKLWLPPNSYSFNLTYHRVNLVLAYIFSYTHGGNVLIESEIDEN